MKDNSITVPRSAVKPVAKGVRRTYDPVLIGLWIALVIAAIVWLIPFAFIIFTSLKSRADLFSTSAFTFPAELYWQNYERAWGTAKFSLYGLNSVVISLTKVPLGIFISAMAAFAFSRMRFRYQKLLFMLVVMGTMIPIQVALGPIFNLILRADLLSTYIGILLPYLAFGIPYHVFLFNGFFKSIPTELDEAALIDGCTRFGLFWRIILPLSLPVLAAVFILDFVSTWNEFAIALVILQDSDSWTIPLGLMGFRGQFTSEYGPLNAAIVMSILPIVLVYLIFQRYFVTGLTAGAVKG